MHYLYRYIYSFLLYLIIPYLIIRLYWRSRRLPAYRQRISERFAYYPDKLQQCIWLHAVSVGETVAAVPLIKALQACYPNKPMLVTTMTPTGSAQVQALLGNRVKHVYLPYDFPDAASRFLQAMQPVIGIMMETELWPNLLAACYNRHIPVCLLNARLSVKSARGYHCIAPLMRAMLAEIAVIAAHGQADAQRFIALGAAKERVVVTGNLKFDLELPADLAEKSNKLRELLGKDRFIWLAASTHAGEEQQILAAHRIIQEKSANALLILIPRHPDRFQAVAELCQQQGFVITRRSQQQTCLAETAIYLGDTMGELLLFYAAADVAFVGGSLLAKGGHNILEPAALAKPILTGPYLVNFAEISLLFTDARALIQVADVVSLAKQLISLLQNPEECLAMGQRARQVMAANRGALAKQIEIIKPMIAG